MAKARPAPTVPAASSRFRIGLDITERTARIVARADGDFVIGIEFLGPLPLILRWPGVKKLLAQRSIACAAGCQDGQYAAEHDFG